MAEPAYQLPEEDQPDIGQHVPYVRPLEGVGTSDGIPRGNLRSVPPNEAGSNGASKADGAEALRKKESAPKKGEEGSLFNPDKDQPNRRQRVKGKVNKLKSNKLLVGGLLGSSTSVIIGVILLVILVGSFKLPDIMQSIEAYQFASVSAAFNDSASNITSEALVEESLSDRIWSQVKGTFTDSEIFKNIRATTWGKLDNFRPSLVAQTISDDNGLQWQFKASLIPGRKPYLTGALVNGDQYEVASTGPIVGNLPVIGKILRTRNENAVRIPVLQEVMENVDPNIGTVTKAFAYRQIVTDSGGSQAGMLLGGFDKEDPTKPIEPEVEATQQTAEASEAGETVPDNAVTAEIAAADSAVDAADKSTAASKTETAEAIKDLGDAPAATKEAAAALSPTLTQSVIHDINFTYGLVAPVCIAYDSSVIRSMPSIENSMNQQQDVFDKLASSAGQQQNGDVTATDGAELAAAVQGESAEIGGEDSAIPYARSNGDPVDTAPIISAEAGAGGSYAYSVFDALGLPASGVTAKIVNGITGGLCKTLTNTYFGIGFAAGNVALGVTSFGTAPEVEGTIEAAGDTSISDFIQNVVANSRKALFDDKVIQTPNGKVVHTALYRAERFAFKQGLIVGATVGASEFAHLIVASRSGEANSGLAQNNDLLDEADSGANIQANEYMRTVLFGIPLTSSEVTQDQQSRSIELTDANAAKSFTDRYFSLDNYDSLFTHIGLGISTSLSRGFFASILHLAASIFKPTALIAELGKVFDGRALADSQTNDSLTQDYANVQFGWTAAEQKLIDSNASYHMLENQKILDDGGNEAKIATKYAVCFGYTYNPNGNGDIDPTDAAGNLTTASAPGEPGALGNLLTSDTINGNMRGIVRDDSGNVINSGLCSPSALSFTNNPDPLSDDEYSQTAPHDMILRWRLAMRYDSTISTLTNDQTVTADQNPSSTSPSSSPTGTSKKIKVDSTSATNFVRQEATQNIKVGYALIQSDGMNVSSDNASSENYGASITKSMILVAYLNQVGSATLSAYASQNLTGMIELSDDNDSNNVYHLLNNPQSQIETVARQAGMTGFKFDASDPLYVLGQSQITADDFARFFSKIDRMFPEGQKTFALGLLSHITPQAGLLQAGLPGTVYSKEGWKPEPGPTNPFGNEGSPWVVNQAGQFSSNGTTYGLAVTVSGVANEMAGETVVENLVTALLHSGQ
jgi:hypothetical protein